MEAKILLSGKPKTTKSTLLNALVLKPVTSTGAIEATAAAIFVSGGTSADDEAIKVHRTDGHVAIEPKKFLVEKYTGREVEENIRRIDLQTDSDFLSDDIVLIDTPGTSSSGGDFSKRHDAIAFAELEHADLRVHLTRDGSELMRLNTQPHQPILIVLGYKDTNIDMASASPFAPVKEQRLRLERASKALNFRFHFCAPLIGLAELLPDEHFEYFLALAGCSDPAFNRLISPRDCLGSEFSGVPFSLKERQSLLSEMSDTLLLSAGQSRYGAWPVLRLAIFFARHYQIKDINELRGKLSDFSGVPQLRQAIRAYLGEVPALRIYRALLDAVKNLIEKNAHELSSLRQKTSALEDALANAEGTVCEITAAAQPVLELLKSSVTSTSGRLLRYEKALFYLQSPSPLEDTDGEARRVLQWLVENNCEIPFAVRQQAIEALRTE